MIGHHSSKEPRHGQGSEKIEQGSPQAEEGCGQEGQCRGGLGPGARPEGV